MFYQSLPAAKTVECNSTPLGIQMVPVHSWGNSCWHNNGVGLLHRQHQFTYYLSQAGVMDVGMLNPVLHMLEYSAAV